MCELYSYRKVKLDIKITRPVNAYVLFDEASPCLLEDVYKILILCYWRPLRVEHHNSGLISLDTRSSKTCSYTYTN
jgi:hypothetical protein